MSQETQDQLNNWKTQIYVIGAALGAFLGFFSAYLFAKEAEDSTENEDERPEVPATALLGLALSVIGVVRQIAEAGRKDKDRKK